jgi:hypothetical protein
VCDAARVSIQRVNQPPGNNVEHCKTIKFKK